MVIFYSTTSF